MHEASLVREVLEAALRQAREQGVRKITDLYFRIHAGGEVTEESLRFYVELYGKGTPAEGARVHVEVEPARYRCFDCGEVFAGEEGACPECGGTGLPLPPPWELKLEAMEAL